MNTVHLRPDAGSVPTDSQVWLIVWLQCAGFDVLR